jgi:hypothetical protein
MNPQEKDLLTRFLEQLTSARAGQKDTEAERLISEAVARQPDAAYLLVQRALQLDQAFQATQAQVTKLQSELDQSRTGTSGGFLNDANAWGSRPAAPAAPAAAPQAASGAAPQPSPAAAPPARPSPWGSNLLGTMAMTAGGVVAGSFLFQGIQGLMNRNQDGAGQHTAAAQDSPHTSGPLEESPSDTYADAEGFDDSGGDIA